MLKTRYLIVLSLATLPMTTIADTYKCRAPDGKITYAGQMSLTPGVKCEQIFVRKPPMTQTTSGSETSTTEKPENAEPQASATTPPVEKSSADKKFEAKRKKADSDEAKKKANDDAERKLAEQKLKEENCQNAKNNVQTYSHGGRISKINEKGEREFLEDNDIKQKLEQSQKDVDKWCGT